MGFFDRFRFKKKEEKEAGREDFQSQMEGVYEEDLSDEKKAQNYIINCCKQMIESGKELEEEKAEYRIVTDYLTDIQILEELPEEDLAEIRGAAENVQNLNNMRDSYHNSEKRISDVQFVQMQQEEETIPDAIRRLQENEDYQSIVKRDMSYLEGEKNEWYYNKMELLRQQQILKRLSFALLALFALSTAVLFALRSVFSVNTTYAWLAVIFLSAVGGFYIFMKMSSGQTEIKKSEVNMNYAIVLLNKVKFKYVNVTNAVDYAREKYHVRNAYEFNYLWEQYLNERKEREKFEQANEDLEYYNIKLVRLLKRYRLYDASVWTSQASALVDKKEMVEVKHNLVARRQKLRSRIEYSVEDLKNRRAELDRILKQENLDTPEVRRIINSMERSKTV